MLVMVRSVLRASERWITLAVEPHLRAIKISKCYSEVTDSSDGSEPLLKECTHVRLRPPLRRRASWTAPSNPELLDIRSPHDRSVIGRAAQAQPADVDHAVAAARAAFEKGTWRTTAPLERVAILRRFNALREANAEKIASLISAENGSSKLVHPHAASRD